MSSSTAGSRGAPIPDDHDETKLEETPNAAIIAAICRHHAQLAEQLRNRTEAVVSSVYTGNYAPARDALHHWYNTELVPHIVAEEQALYGPAADLEATGLFVRSMLVEHESLVALIEDLAFAPGPFEASTTAVAAEAVFTVHLRKENDLLLPALDQAGLDLGSILTGMREILGHSPSGESTRDPGCGCSCGAAEDETGGQESVATDRSEELDVRVLTHDSRHEIIFAKLEQLEPGGSLVIVNDHDPKPLHYQISAMWPDRFGWSYLQAGPQQWRVSITRAG